MHHSLQLLAMNILLEEQIKIAAWSKILLHCDLDKVKSLWIKFTQFLKEVNEISR